MMCFGIYIIEEGGDLESMTSLKRVGTVAVWNQTEVHGTHTRLTEGTDSLHTIKL